MTTPAYGMTTHTVDEFVAMIREAGNLGAYRTAATVGIFRGILDFYEKVPAEVVLAELRRLSQAHGIAIDEV